MLFLNCNTSLLEDVRRYHRIVVRYDSPGVDQGECFAAPVNLAVDSISRYTRFITNDCAALSNQTVEERRLADIRTADNGYERRRIGRLVWKFLKCSHAVLLPGLI